MTIDMVKELANKIYKMNNMNLAIVGPFDKKDKKSIESNLRL